MRWLERLGTDATISLLDFSCWLWFTYLIWFWYRWLDFDIFDLIWTLGGWSSSDRKGRRLVGLFSWDFMWAAIIWYLIADAVMHLLAMFFCSSWEILREIPHSFPYRSPITRYWVRDCCLMSHPSGFWDTHIESDKRAMLTTGQNTSSSPSHPELLWKLEIPVDPAALTLPLPSSSSQRRVILRNSREQRPINICLLLKLIWVQTLHIWHGGRKDYDLL